MTSVWPDRVAPAAPTRRRLADAGLVAAASGLVALAAGVGVVLERSGVVLLLGAPPVLADWGPHLGPGTVPALLCVVAAVWLQRRVDVLAWRELLVRGWAIGLAWIVSLALVDGDWTAILLSPHEYLAEVDQVGEVGPFLADFTRRIVGVPDAWTTHVSAHPPLATLVFWGLDRLGLGGGWWGGLACMAVGSLALPALASALRDLGAEPAARRLLPFAAVFPGAVWIGVSADGLFAGVSGLALACCVRGATRDRWWASLAGGLLAGAMLYLSYGHVLYGLVLLTAAGLAVGLTGWAVVLRAAAVGLAGLAAVGAAFTAAGFSWWEALGRVHERYYEGIAAVRPYGYFVWANLAAVVVAVSPLIAPALRWAAAGLRGAPSVRPAAWLSLAGVAAILVADLSGLSKAETERIWLTFTATAWCAVGLAPRRWRTGGLLLAAGWALSVNHLLQTEW